MPDYEFSADYVSYVASVWVQHLAHLRGREDARMLEIGSFEGRSALWFLENALTHPSAALVCVDKFAKDYSAVFDRNLKSSGWARKVTKLCGKSQNILPTLPKASFDAIYIDGDHRAAAVWRDAQESWRLVKPNGIIIFDDYRWALHRPPAEPPKQAIDRFLTEYGPRLQVLHKGYQVMVRRFQ
jgi:predicted O-methyltransferase YrrM